MKTILLTELCLSGNKGGPALVSGILSVVKKYKKNVKFMILSSDLNHDHPLSDYYGIEVVSPRQVPKNGTKIKRSLSKINKFICIFVYHLTGKIGLKKLKLNPLLKIYLNSSLVIDMTGVSFASSLSFRQALSESKYILIPWLLRVPVVKFTQTYGPFNSWSRRLLVKFVLRKAKVVMVRERQSLKYLKNIGIECNKFLFPDVAISMPAVSFENIDLPEPKRNFITSSSKLVGISPSTKVIREEFITGKKTDYRKLIINISNFLIREKGFQILLIPHTYKPWQISDDDYSLCQDLYRELKKNGDKVSIIEQDFKVEEIKAIIGRCDYFIGSRYHSLVASLSKGVPSIAIGWSHKYDGLFDWFGVSEYSLWNNRINLQQFKDSFENLLRDAFSIRMNLLEKKKELDSKISISGKIINEILVSQENQDK